MTRSAHIVLILFVGGVAAALRTWRLWWGLDDGLWFPDEIRWATRLLRFVPLTCDAFWPDDLIYPTLYGYVGGLTASLTQRLGLADVAAPMTTIGAIRIARLVSVVAGVGTVGLVWLVGRRLYGARVGLAAAALMAVVPLEAMQVHYASVDVLLGTCVVLVLFAAARLSERATIGRATIAGAAVGLAFSVKYPGVMVGSAVAWVVLEQGWKRQRPWQVVTLGLAALAGFALAVVVSCPPCVLDHELMAKAYRFHRSATTIAAFGNNHLEPSLGWWGRPYLYQIVAGLPFTLGIALHGAALAGTAAAMLRWTRPDRLLIASIVPYFVLIGSSDVTFPRYLLPIVPALTLLAARFMVGTRPGRLHIAVVCVVCVYTGGLAASQVRRFSYDQQREVVEWIAARVPTPAARWAHRVHVPSYGGYFRLRPVFRREGIPAVFVRSGLRLHKDPAIIVLPEWWATHMRRDKPSAATILELDRLEDGRAGYRETARWAPSSYLQGWLDRRLDPGSAGHLFQGDIGFRIYVRNDLRGW